MISDIILPPPNAVGTTQRMGTCQYFQRRASPDQLPPLLEPPLKPISTLPSPGSLPSPRIPDLFERSLSHQRTSPKPLDRPHHLPPTQRHLLKPLDIPLNRSDSYSRLSPVTAGTTSSRDWSRDSVGSDSLPRYRETLPSLDSGRTSPGRMPLQLSGPSQQPSQPPTSHYHILSPSQISKPAQLPSPSPSYPSPSTSVEGSQSGEPRSSKAPSRGWKPEEDERLVAAMQIHNGSNYKAIAEMVGNGRTPKQCRERYHENLAGHLSHEKATDAEIEYIVQLVERHGRKWSKIAQVLGNRAPNTVKNFYNSRKKPIRNQKAHMRQSQAQAQSATQRHAPVSLPSFSQQRPLPSFEQQPLHLPPFAQTQPQALYAGY